jgi:hypothetical protein
MCLSEIGWESDCVCAFTRAHVRLFLCICAHMLAHLGNSITSHELRRTCKCAPSSQCVSLSVFQFVSVVVRVNGAAAL